jgi:pimeloyl-ACP methyl ester carboxylesterase
VTATPGAPWEIVEPADRPPEGPPIVFVHGTRLTRMAWWPQLIRLGRSRRCIAIDLPGHGLRAAEPFSLTAAAAAVRTAIDDAAGGRAIVVGLSLGGYVGILAATGSPGRVTGLVLAGTTQEPVGLPAIPYWLLAVALERIPAPWLDAVNDAWFRFRYPGERAELISAAGYWPAGGAAGVRAILGRRFAPHLATFPGPVLVLNGEFDVLFRIGEPGFLAAAPGAARRRLRGAVHLSNLDAPDAFAEAVAAFADRVAARPR